jgi:uncharacterized protein YndB with AHSA1/START domain
MTEEDKTQRQRHEIEIDAPVEAVWKALTDAEELTRWFVEKARVTPGVGGTIWGAWDEMNEAEKRIEVWEPGKRLVLGGHNHMMEEYTLEAKGGRTVLRMVFSFVPDTADWSGFYDATNYGWQSFFRALRHYLERHPGQHRGNIVIMYPMQMGVAEAWSKLTGPEGLCAEGTLDAEREGSRYSVTTSGGEHIEGEVALTRPPKILLLTMDNLFGAMLSVGIEAMGGTTYFYSTLGLFGASEEELASVKDRWSAWFREVIPPGSMEQPA